VFSPIIIQFLIKANWIGLARVVAAIGYSWMGFALLFFTFALVDDTARAVLWILGRVTRFGTSQMAMLSSPQVTAAIVLAALLACVYGVYAARQINFTRITFPTAKLAPGHAPFRIVQITDLHLGVLTSEARVRRMIAAINALHPDLVVSTGDLVDMQADHISKYAPILRMLHATYGRYAVTGNHEAIAGIEGSLGFTRDAGFTVLSSEGMQIDKLINIVGVDDPSVIRMTEQAPPSEVSVLRQFNNGHVTVLLKHQPVVDRAAAPYFDLQLSGHVHGGQIFPFGLLTWLIYRVHMGMSQVAPGTWLYVSYGSGTWGPPIRFFAPPEITVFDIVPARKTDS